VLSEVLSESKLYAITEAGPGPKTIHTSYGVIRGHDPTTCPWGHARDMGLEIDYGALN
jgi:hypothetical protein